MKLMEIRKKCKKVIKEDEKYLTDKEADCRYEFCKNVMELIDKYKEMEIRYENCSRELISRTDKLRDMEIRYGRNSKRTNKEI